MQRFFKKVPYVGIVLSVVFLGGCNGFPDMSTASQVNLRQVRLAEVMKAERINVLNIDRSEINRMARDYVSNGKGGIEMTVVFASGRPLDEAEVKKSSKVLKKIFAMEGVSDLDIHYVPVTGNTEHGDATLSWVSLAALPPEGCTERMPGYNGAETLKEMKAYQIGCEVQTSFSKMIVDPSDLRGVEGLPDDSARRQGEIVEGYTSGTPNDPIQGMQASTIGGGGS